METIMMDLGFAMGRLNSHGLQLCSPSDGDEKVPAQSIWIPVTKLEQLRDCLTIQLERNRK